MRLKFKARTGMDLELSLFTVPMICRPLSGQPINWDNKRFPYLHGLDLADLCK